MSDKSDKNFQKKTCNFCGLTEDEVDYMFSSGISESHICGECVRFCYEAMQEEEKESDC